jgi:hypothetical protein
MVGMIVFAIVACYQVSSVYARIPIYASGYDKAAEHILDLSKSPTVFFDGHGEAIFVYFMRAFDPNRSMYIFRGRKILSSSVFHSRKGLVVHANSAEDIREIFDKYGIEYIIVESEYRAKIARIHQKLREFLNSGPFRLVKEIEIESNHPKLIGQNLKIYKYLNAKPITADFLEIRLPAVSLTIRAPIRCLRALEPASIEMSTDN